MSDRTAYERLDLPERVRADWDPYGPGFHDICDDDCECGEDNDG